MSFVACDKRCSRCGTEKPADQFYLDRRTRDGLTSHCKSCRREAARRYASANRSAVTEGHKRWYAANHRAARAITLRTRYGIDHETYDRMLAEQDSCCGLCLSAEPGGNRKYFCVDHDRSCCPGDKSCGGCVRGLLCVRCNGALGFFRDDTAALARAIEYLGAHRSRRLGADRGDHRV